jgi:hypothetical protein
LPWHRRQEKIKTNTTGCKNITAETELIDTLFSIQITLLAYKILVWQYIKR